MDHPYEFLQHSFLPIRNLLERSKKKKSAGDSSQIYCLTRSGDSDKMRSVYGL